MAAEDTTSKLWEAVEALQREQEKAKSSNDPRLAEIEQALIDAVLAYKRAVLGDMAAAVEGLDQARQRLEKFTRAASNWPFSLIAPEDHETPNRDVEDKEPVVSVPGGGPSPLTGKALTDRKKGYQALWDSMDVSEAWLPQARAIAEKIIRNQARYNSVVAGSSIPWWFVGIVHAMECSLRFDQHLHNGDKLSERTVRIPAGRPASGFPPFTWEASAKDALACDDIDKVTDWSLPNVLYLWHRYNGVTNEYSRRGIPTPYLWSGSQFYKKGKYVADRKFDPEAVSKQVGAAVLLWMLVQLKAVEIATDKTVQTNVLAAAASPSVLATVSSEAAPAGMESAEAETAFPGELSIDNGKAAKTKQQVRRVQEWLHLHGFATPVDGNFGESTKTQLARFQEKKGRVPTGKLDEETWTLLVAPMLRALARTDPAPGTSLQEAMTKVALQHIAQMPREVGGQNRGPWVRLYMAGNQGDDQLWCAGFVCFIAAQAARDLKTQPPFRRQVGVDALVADAIGSERFIDGASLDPSRRSSKIPPGSIYVVRKSKENWTHCGIVNSLAETTFDTLEGNTSIDGGNNGTVAMEGNRSYDNKDFLLLI